MDIVAVAAGGVLAIWAVVAVINSRPSLVERFDCDSVSPDGDLRCTESMAHNGWCRSGDIEWRYEAWAIGADDYTRAAQPPDEPTKPIAKKAKRRIPRTLFWGGLAFVFGIHLVNIDNHKPAEPPPPKVQHCDHWWAWQCDHYT